MTSLTEELAVFAAGMHSAVPPPDTRDIVVTGFTDCVATMLAGRDEPVVGVVRGVLGSLGTPVGARLLLSIERAAPHEAALLNGTAGHALDYDDVALSAHPSTVIVPALLAEGETLDAPGALLVTAYVAGYEVWAELCQRDREHHHRKGWHPTAVFGAVAATAACAALRGLDAARARHALGISASMAGGLVANFGTMTKPFHAGRAAEAGVLATRLAAGGMTASPDALEHPLGFLAAFSPSGRVDTGPARALGREWRLPRLGLSVKKYPLCYSTHRSLDAVLGLRQEHGFSAHDVTAVEVEMSETQAAVLRNSRPQTGLDAKFSEEFAMAAATIAGRAGLQELRDDFVQRADVQGFFPKVTVRTNTLEDPDDPVFSPTETVDVRLADGRSLHREVRHARGHARAPLSTEELWAKFADCLGDAYPQATARELFDALQRIDRLASVRALPTLAADGARPAH